MKRISLLALIAALLLSGALSAQEKIFATYFDIAAGSPKGSEVTGRIHLERNKDVLKAPVPRSYRFTGSQQQNGLFTVSTTFDPAGRIMGILTAQKPITASLLGNHVIEMELKDGNKTINRFSVTVKVVKETLWQTLLDRYKNVTLTGANGRMYGRTKFRDAEVAALMESLEKSGGRFAGYGFYTTPVTTYKPIGKSIEYDWENVANKIGGLGYSYATSKKYGPGGDASERQRLKGVIYSALVAYADAIPVEGSDVIIDGKPIGECTGDGFSNLKLHGLLEEQVVTHQWVISDALIAPLVHLMPEMLADIKKGNKLADRTYYAMVRLYQTAMAEVANRRAIDNPGERWGELQDTLRSSGAWADANLGHRSRMMLALPIIWADYNRPMTYVQYWYSDYYHDKPFKNFSFSPGWSPHGVVADVARWLTKYNVPAHQYIQSGFQPDGTISHHVANATDAAMVAYGFEWLTDCFVGFNQYKNTGFKLGDTSYQFPADRLLRVYPKLIYKGRFEFLVAGRSYIDDLKKFVSHTYLSAIDELKATRSANTNIRDLEKLEQVYDRVKNNRYEYSGTDAYWINEFLVHRRGENEESFYVSLKLKSKRTVGAEDFGKTRKSWYAGYGILPLKVRGDEYSETVLRNMDWHALPGLTEEWRTDAIPTGHAQASLPGDNDLSGVTADGRSGLGIYHHLPRETYSAATAYKSWHFTENKVVALGSGIRRLRSGQGKEIITTIDQSSFRDALTVFHDGKTERITPGQSVNRTFETGAPVWMHTGEKGYLIFPQGLQKIIIQTGDAINVTDRGLATGEAGYIIAIGHKTNPSAADPASYAYCLVPNVAATDMPGVVERYGKEATYKKETAAHAFYDAGNKTWQAAFFKAGTISIGNMEIKADQPALFLLRDNGNSWKLTVSNPAPDIRTQQLSFHISTPLKAGRYDYMLGGIYPRKGEFVTISGNGAGCRIVAELADKRDEAAYNYQAALYNAAPVNIEIFK